MNLKRLFAVAAGVLTIGFSNVQAQEEGGLSSDAGMDIYSSYVWRGAKFGTGAAFQPWMEFSTGSLAFGAWGSVNSGAAEAFEMDLYASYSFEFGLGLTVTDYYFGGEWTEFGIDSAVHFYEPSLSYEAGKFSFMGAYMTGAEDIYLQIGYAGDVCDVTLGIGEGFQYTGEEAFNVCNVTFSKSKEIEITDKFVLPLTGAITINPALKGFYTYVGISL